MAKSLTTRALLWLVWSVPAGASAQTPSLLQQMVGTWSVEQRMWPGPDAEAVVLPAATAERRLIDDKYLEESMRPTAVSAGRPDSFSRNAFINYNSVEKRFEYFSIDTRAPQVMNERSARTEDTSGINDVSLRGGKFVAPEWGKRKNVRFTYRLILGGVRDREQTVRLYLTPEPKLRGREFLAFEYKYVRLQ